MILSLCKFWMFRRL